MELSGSNIKKFQERETPKKIPYISGNGNPKKPSYISGNGTFQSKPRENFLYSNMKKFHIFSQKQAFAIFQETETPKKIPFISVNGNPKKLLLLQEVTFRARKMKKKKHFKIFSYISGNGTFLYFRR